MKDLDRATIIAISALAYSLANVVHEGLGHGGACILFGARPTMFNAIFFNYDEATASDSVQRAISSAGSVVNVIVGLPLTVLLRSRVALSPRWRYFLWLFCAVNLLTAFGYLLYSGIGGIGDWARVIEGARPAALYRLALVVSGALLYFVVAPRLLMPALDPFLGREPDARVARARQLSLIPYLVGAGTLVAAGLLNPLGMKIVLISAAAASLGGTSLLAWYPAIPRAPSPYATDVPLGITRGVPWIVAGVIAMAFFVLVLGPGIGHASAATDPQSPAPPPLAITHVSIIDTEGDSTRRDRTVVIRNGRIDRIDPATAPPPKGARVLEGRGKFLIPGLWDMHVHLSYVREGALPVLLANGVTGVRDMGSDLSEIDRWRAEIGAGVRAGPRIVRAGPMLNGQSFNRYQLVTGGPEQARGIVRALKQAGVDFIKVHRRVPRDDYFAIVDEARKQGLRVVGHIPMTVRPEEASDAGQLIEHEETLFEGTFSAGLSPEALPDSIHRFLAGPAADTLVAHFVRNQTSLTSTLITWRYAIRFSEDTTRLDPRIQYVPRSMREALRKRMRISAADLPAQNRVVADYGNLVARLNRAGVTLLAGTDIPGGLFPGFSLHDELAALVEAGLAPIEALRTATSNPARVLGKEADVGTIAQGKNADLVLLDANPLDDVRNTRRIAAVIFGGKLYRRADLDSLLRMGAELADKN